MMKDVQKAIKHFESVRDGAVAVLDSGFGTNPGESDKLYKSRILYAELAISALKNCQKHEEYQQIKTTVNGFWSELQKLSMFKGKKTPTMEELLEYIEQVKAESAKECAKKIKIECGKLFDLPTYTCIREIIDIITEETEGEMALCNSTLCKMCLHGEVCAERESQDEDDERAMKYCVHFKNKADFIYKSDCSKCLKSVRKRLEDKFTEGKEGSNE